MWYRMAQFTFGPSKLLWIIEVGEKRGQAALGDHVALV